MHPSNFYIHSSLVIASEDGSDEKAVAEEMTLIGVACAALLSGWCVVVIGRENYLDQNFTQLHAQFPDLVALKLTEEL